MCGLVTARLESEGETIWCRQSTSADRFRRRTENRLDRYGLGRVSPPPRMRGQKRNGYAERRRKGVKALSRAPPSRARHSMRVALKTIAFVRRRHHQALISSRFRPHPAVAESLVFTLAAPLLRPSSTRRCTPDLHRSAVDAWHRWLGHEAAEFVTSRTQLNDAPRTRIRIARVLRSSQVYDRYLLRNPRLGKDR